MSGLIMGIWWLLGMVMKVADGYRDYPMVQKSKECEMLLKERMAGRVRGLFIGFEQSMIKEDK